MSLLETVGDYNFAEYTIPQLTQAMNALAAEIKRANDLKEEELKAKAKETNDEVCWSKKI